MMPSLKFPSAAAVALSFAAALMSPIGAAEVGTVFVATPPYSPTIGETTVNVDLGGKARRFDFGGNAPFINAVTGVADMATINVWDSVNHQASVLTSSRIGPAGVAGRVFKTGGYTAVGYVRGDGIVEGKLRTQINSFPIPARKHFFWDLTFRLGGASLSSPWTYSARGVAPATIWQLKTEGLPPAVVMAFDTDPDDSSKLALSFDRRLNPSKPAINLGRIGGLSPLTDIKVGVDAFLDERSIVQGGKGFLRISVNGKLVVDVWGPVLQEVATQPYHWSLAMYLFSNTEPLPFDRFVFWKTARLMSFD